MRLNRLLNKIVVGVIVILFFSSFAGRYVYTSVWQKVPLRINQFENLWNGKYLYDQKSKFYYGLTNDSLNLYVAMKTSDKILKRKILMVGLTFWMDTTGKGKQQLGLIFPIKHNPSFEMMKKMGADRQHYDNELKKNPAEIKQFNERYVSGMRLVDKIGFGGEATLTTSYNISLNGINVLLRIDSLDFLYYEAQIPLKLIFNNPAKHLGNPSKYFSYSFETSKIKMPYMGFEGRPPGSGMTHEGNNRPPEGDITQAKGSPGTVGEMNELTQISHVSIKKAILSTNRK